jgi:hypothetical protein
MFIFVLLKQSIKVGFLAISNKHFVIFLSQKSDNKVKSEKEKNFHPVLQNRGNNHFSDYSYNRKEVRTSGGKNIASDIFYPDVCYMAPTLVRVQDEGQMSDLRRGFYESSPSVVERQELDLAIDLFDYCVFGRNH